MSRYLRDANARQRRTYLSHLDNQHKPAGIPVDDLKVDAVLAKALADDIWPGKKPKDFYFSYPELMMVDQVVDLVSLRSMMEFLDLDWSQLDRFLSRLLIVRNQINYKLAVVLTQNGTTTVY